MLGNKFPPEYEFMATVRGRSLGNFTYITHPESTGKLREKVICSLDAAFTMVFVSKRLRVAPVKLVKVLVVTKSSLEMSIMPSPVDSYIVRKKPPLGIPL